MHRSYDPSSHSRQSLREQTKCFFRYVCDCPLNRRVVECILQLPNTGFIDPSLVFLIAELYGFAGIGVVRGIFVAKSNSKIMLRLIAHQLDALFLRDQGNDNEP